MIWWSALAVYTAHESIKQHKATYQPSSLFGRVTYTLLLDGERRILIGQPVDVAEIRGIGGVICFTKGSCGVQDYACHGWT